MSAILSICVFMNKQKSKVLFAEADSEFVDALLTFLALPLGRIIDILDEEGYGSKPPIFKSLASLRTSFEYDEALTDFSMERRTPLSTLLNPISSLADEIARLKLDISESRRTEYYFCKNPSCVESGVCIWKMYNGSVYSGDAYACDCGKTLAGAECEGFGDGKLTRDDVSFIVFDDLRVLPNVHGLRSTLLNLGITDLDDVEMVIWHFDLSSITDLFKLALFSATPLTDYAIFFTGKNADVEIINLFEKISTAAKPHLFHLPVKNPFPTMLFDIITLSISLQKSTKKFLYALARRDFLEFLCSLLAIPFGRVQYLFGGKTAFKCIDNLYTSLRDNVGYKYFTHPRIKKTLICPTLPYGYNLRNKCLISPERVPPMIYARKQEDRIYLSYEVELGALASHKPIRDSIACFVKPNVMCTLSDDLSATPYSIASSVELLKDMEVPLSDVEEIDFEIKFDEAMRILKAALTSDTVLTDALISPMLEASRQNQA